MPLRVGLLLCLLLGCSVLNAAAQLKAGVARVSITPLEAGLATQLGGYGERNGKPAEGIHDTINAKAIVFELEGRRGALVSLDICTMTRCLAEEAIAAAAVPGLDYANTIICATHSHAGTEGLSMERRNQVGNPHIGIFDEKVLHFTRDRLAKAIQEAAAALRPVQMGVGVKSLPGMNRNRRHDGAPTDNDMTVLRFDTEDGKPYVVLVNYTAHPTISVPETMLISCDWPGFMQRTVEDMMPGAVCVYTNGSEGDVAPRGHTGGSRWEMMENYGRRLGIAAVETAGQVKWHDVSTFGVYQHIVPLPERRAAPDFLKIAGDEYGVKEEQMTALLEMLWPVEAPLYLLRFDDVGLVTFPGEPITAIGLAAKEALRARGLEHTAVVALANEHIGYILTPEEYALSGYEVTASFYGPDLGPVLLRGAAALAEKATR